MATRELSGAQQSGARIAPISKKMLWTGHIISVLMILFLLMDGVMKLVKPKPVVEGSLHAGLAEGLITPIGIVLLVCTALYAIPRTAVLGAVLLTGYLGGATFAMVRVGQPVYFPVVFGVLVWAGVYLRDARLRALMPLKD